MVNKKELVNKVQEKVGGTKKTALEYVDSTLDVILETIRNHKDVKLIGFGNWEIKEMPSRKGRNPASGEEIMIPAKTVVKFKPGKLMKDAVNGIMVVKG